ncbi:MAG: PH domain-containing protein [Deltaproteobacteria bacterium]|jgi:uncharacterized membrane protein YdbT with pleckstrin-like domain|nr:PH domain-containing protein [Syntrophaceae bacterium]
MGRYVNDNLIDTERVIYETKLHWITFLSLKGLFTLFLAPLVSYLTSEFAVTNKRIIIKTGFISRNTFEMNHSKIESINVNQSILGRILGYGTIVIMGTGSTREPFDRIRDPLAFRRKFLEQQG